MKKAITSKRGRRFDVGGLTGSQPSREVDDQEAADKAAGLAASNKENPTGFFSRLFMGSIDDPSSEAYKRFGAGRGRAERVPVADVTPTPVQQPAIRSRSEGMEAVNSSLEARSRAEREGADISAGERVSQAMASKPDQVVEPTKVVKKPVPKDTSNYSNEGRYKSPVGVSTVKAAQAAADAIGDQPKVKTESVMKKKPVAPVATASTFDAYGLNNYGTPKVEQEKPKSTYKKNSTYAPSGRKVGVSKPKENDVDFGGTGLGMKRGGSVGKASSRADGIAQRGKTRGKMC